MKWFAYHCPGCKQRIWREQPKDKPARHYASVCPITNSTQLMRLSRNQTPLESK
jgi:hypothetical protein